MAKKKISSDDFLRLMTEQEDSREAMAFKPATKTSRRIRGAARPPPPNVDRFGPVRKELVDFAMSKAPGFVSRWAAKLARK